MLFAFVKLDWVLRYTHCMFNLLLLYIYLSLVPCLFLVDAIYGESALVLSRMSHNACFLAFASSIRLKTETEQANYFLGELIKNTLYKTQIAPP